MGQLRDSDAGAAPRTAPIAPDDLPPVPTTHLDHARDRAARRLRGDLAALHLATDEAQHAAQTRRVAAGAAQDAEVNRQVAVAELAQAEEQLAATTTRLEGAVSRTDATRRAATVSATSAERLAEAGRSLDTMLSAGPPARADEVPALRRRLSQLIDEIGAAGDGDHPLDASALSTWRDQLDDGTAPMRADAAAALADLDRVEAAWLECGAGDVSDDPIVVAAVARVAECEAAVAEIDWGGVVGATGHQAQEAIELADQHRTEVLRKGRRADPDELAAATQAVAEALGRVGFDSMLDFRITMSGAGVGALTAQRRRIVADELAVAQRNLERVRFERVQHHADQRALRDLHRRGAVEQFHLAGSLPLRDQLRHLLAIPQPVQDLAVQVQQRAAAATATACTAAADAAAADEEQDAVRAELERDTERVELADQEVSVAEERVRVTRAWLAAAAEQLRAADTSSHTAQLAASDATAEVDGLAAMMCLDEDLDDLMVHVVALAKDRAAAAPLGSDRTVTLSDPLVNHPAELTLRLLDALEVSGTAAVLVTSRRELLDAARERRGGVRVVEGRRRRLRFGQRRRREPTANTR